MSTQDDRTVVESSESKFDPTGVRITASEPNPQSSLLRFDITSAMADQRFLKLKQVIDDIVGGWEETRFVPHPHHPKSLISTSHGHALEVMMESRDLPIHKRSRSFKRLRESVTALNRCFFPAEEDYSPGTNEWEETCSDEQKAALVNCLPDFTKWMKSLPFEDIMASIDVTLKLNPVPEVRLKIRSRDYWSTPKLYRDATDKRFHPGDTLSSLCRSGSDGKLDSRCGISAELKDTLLRTTSEKVAELNDYASAPNLTSMDVETVTATIKVSVLDMVCCGA